MPTDAPTTCLTLRFGRKTNQNKVFYDYQNKGQTGSRQLKFVDKTEKKW